MRISMRLWMVIVLIVVGGFFAHSSFMYLRYGTLIRKITEITSIKNQEIVSCAEIKSRNPLVLLALGQSNAGNHGELAVGNSEFVPLFAEGKCLLSRAPFPGGTGVGGSIWQYLPTHLRPLLGSRPVLLSILAVDATVIDDWTASSSPLRRRLLAYLSAMQAQGFTPNFILWQQGEADAKAALSTEAYSARLDALASSLSGAGNSSPILLARSTICGSPANHAIHLAIDNKLKEGNIFRAGPNTDGLTGDTYRVAGCHLTTAGQIKSAQMWAEAIAQASR